MGKDDLDFLGCFRLETCSPMMQPKKDGQRPISAGRCGKGGGGPFLFGVRGLVKGLPLEMWQTTGRDQSLPNCATQMSDTGAVCSVQLSCGECSWGSRVLLVRGFH